MKVITTKIEEDFIVEEDTQLNGMIVGSVTVVGGVTLQLNGMVIGILQLEEGAVVTLNGTVTGNVVNRGGHLEVRGIVNGELLREGGETIVGPKAIILGS